MVTPSIGELTYEMARREGIVFVPLEEDEDISFDSNRVCIARGGKELIINAGTIIHFDDYAELFKGKDFLSLYRSEPQLRWSPTKWGRRKYHAGFIRHPREQRWEKREVLGALGEMILDNEAECALPQINEERCSGCGSCKEACPASAIEMDIQERQIALFGPLTSTVVLVAHVKEDTCIGCGLCASNCPSDVISFPA
jgi:ferredoxin